MNVTNIISKRLQNQKLIGTSFKKPEEVVSWFGAIQAQDYAGAKWSLGMRLKNISDEDIERAYNDGKILRTHAIRPTWHFVTPEDIRWILQLSAPRVHIVMGYYNRLLELDEKLYKKTNSIIVSSLKRNNYLTRTELVKILKKSGISGTGQRFGHILHHAEIEALICSGPRKGKQFTYALIEERAPHAKILKREEALKELVKRYFTSHGPAQVKDFTWWSGLTVVDAKAGIEMNKAILDSENIDGKMYWFSKNNSSPTQFTSPLVFLLPTYDEYGIAYSDRSALVQESFSYSNLFTQMLVADGKIAGFWRREFKKNTVIITPKFYKNPTKEKKDALKNEAERYGKFLGKEVVVKY